MAEIDSICRRWNQHGQLGSSIGSLKKGVDVGACVHVAFERQSQQVANESVFERTFGDRLNIKIVTDRDVNRPRFGSLQNVAL